MADRMRGDLVAVPMQVVDVIDALAHVLGRAAEIDPRCAAALVRPFVDMAARIGDEIDGADEEREVQAVAVLVHLGRRSR